MPRGTSISDTAFLQRRLWTPAVLRPDAWFDASDLSTITVATGVSEWRDKSGNGRHMSQSTASYQPTLQIEKKNGLSCVRFEAASGAGFKHSMNTSALVNVRSAFCVAYRETTPNGVFNFIFSQAINNTSYQWASDYDDYLCLNVAETANWRNGSNYRNGSATAIVSVDYKDVWSAFSFMCSGAMETSGIGQDRTTGYWGSQGSYGEVIWSTQALADADRLKVEGYLSHKWAIPLAADHPFANRPPLIGD
jgi:hypothetical protein